MPPFEPGQTVRLHYPTSTIIGARRDWRLRVVTIGHIRDLVREPLKPEDFYRRPFIHRGRSLIVGRDATTGERRQFYLGNSLEHFGPSGLRIGLFDPAECRLVQILSRDFGSTKKERIQLANMLRTMQHLEWSGLSVGVFASDLKLVS